ncbi:MAG: SDR family NAD(P)-dependent oxidoreductase [Cyanobacteria bacterium P01_A01_bin.84]
MNHIEGKVVLLTGASGGIGECIAVSLAKEAATVVCVSRSQESLQKVSDLVDANGGIGVSIPWDISKIEELPLLIKQVKQLVGDVDILINNAAIEKYESFERYTQQDIKSILTTNLFAVMELTRLVLPQMIERDRGHIVNITSGSGKKGIAYNSVYSGSKAGLWVWTDALRQELSSSNIGVSIVSPGYTDAGMYAKSGLTAPSSARVAPVIEVATAVLDAIKSRKVEVIIDGFGAKLLFAIAQFFPEFVDTIYRKIGITGLYESYVKSKAVKHNT